MNILYVVDIEGGLVSMLVDSNLPIERDKLQNRFARLVKEDNDIIGAYFSGSIGNKTEDFYSDINARIILKPGIQIEQKQREIIRSIGDYLFIELFDYNHSIIHYATFIKLDLMVYTLEMLEPSILYKHIEIIKDDGTLTELHNLSKDMQYVVTQEVFDHILNQYYADYFNLYRAWRRNESNHIESIVLSIKQHLVSMWYLSKGTEPNIDDDWRNYEGEKSRLSHLEKEFILSYTPFDIKEIEVFTNKIAILMLEASEKVAVYDDLFFSRPNFMKVHDRISFTDEI